MKDRDLSKAILVSLIGLLVIMSGSTAVSAQPAGPISNPRANHTFGEEIIFEADLEPGTEFTNAYLTFQTRGSNQSIVLPVELKVLSILQARVDLTNQNPMAAFSELEFWFTVVLPDGSKVQSEKVNYLFSDNRFTWQSITVEDHTKVSWVEGDLTLAQGVEDVIYQHRENFGRYLDLPYPDLIQIYIYPTVSAYQSALELSNIAWTAGHANPDQNTILMVIPTGFDQQLDIQRQIPHEIAHIRLASYLEGNSEVLPMWFNEGIASLAESFTAPEYWQILQNAYQKDNLIPLEDLCSSFPYYSDDAALAYAESESFVSYLETRYGKAGLQALLDAYKSGQTCQNGVLVALGSNLERLEADWFQATFNQGIVPRSVGAIIAWVILLVIVLAAPLVLVLISIEKKGGLNE
ncbi:MAG: hypothetical protein JW757_11240 [Anaerolineales bacterium]|nr:hypothetical protein [Anaerolineales bacterium]